MDVLLKKYLFKVSIKEINMLITKGMSNIYVKVTVRKTYSQILKEKKIKKNWILKLLVVT